jgi:translocation and assembly module TamB
MIIMPLDCGGQTGDSVWQMEDVVPQRRSWLRIALIIGALLTLALLLLWTQRKPIARAVIERQLHDRSIAARYDIKAIGTAQQRLEHISLGDPKNPDLTAEWAEIDTVPSLSGVSVKAVRAGGVRLRGQLVGGVLSWGEVDKLIPASTGGPFRLPDIDVELADARMRLDTPYGPVGATVNGKGNIASSFVGKVAVVLPQGSVGGCRAGGLTAWLDVTTAGRSPALAGPVRAQGMSCGRLLLVHPQIGVSLKLAETFDHWDGRARLLLDAAQVPNATTERLGGTISFSGDKSDTRGTVSLAAASGAAGATRLGRLSASGTFGLGVEKGGLNAQATGTATASRIILDKVLLARMSRPLGAAQTTPVGPIAAALTKSIAGLGEPIEARTRFTVAHQSGAGRLSLSDFAATSHSGVRLALKSGEGATFSWPGRHAKLNAVIALSGGGFPDATITLAGDLPALTGTAQIAPMAAGGSRLALAPVRFGYDRDGLRIATVATLDAPFSGGHVVGWSVPVSVSNGELAGGCLPFSFQSAEMSGLLLAPTRASVCLEGGAARFASPRFSGKLGESPVTISAKSALIGRDFAVDSMAVRLGNADHLTMLDVAKLTGSLRNGVIDGRFAGTSGKIGAVPLLFSEAAGSWRLANSILTLGSALRVADATNPGRFQPLSADAATLRMANGVITAAAPLREPGSKALVANVTLTHILKSGTGEALLDVPGLSFGPALQPEALTRLTLGVIANLKGNVTGQGMIRWTSAGVTSNGRFASDNLDFAAAFGPVTGLKGTVNVSDLLGLTTAPGQIVTVGAINPGVVVSDGNVRYQLQPGLKMAIEGGHWPFAGGDLILEPTVLDLSEKATRQLTFRIRGLDAAQFVNQLAFENISATGTFDGVLPMVFDQTGGRIEAGNLVVREGGGTLSYLGEVSKADLPFMGSIAFDALKSLRYRTLSIDLGGPLDGEMVTQIRFRGINQATIRGIHTKLPIKITGLTGIPFIFNIKITAPFRGLFATARSINDPSVFLDQVLPAQLQRVKPAKPVQPKESETVR